jgi:hypothetical protein
VYKKVEGMMKKGESVDKKRPTTHTKNVTKKVQDKAVGSSVERTVHPKKRASKMWAIGVGSVLAVLLASTIGVFLYNARMLTDRIIVRDIGDLDAIFKTIHERAVITGFEHDVNYVDFLNITSFAGRSGFGPINLRNPEGWEGPYVEDNPKVQTKLYEIVRTKQGHFLVPGSGVKLSSGLILGRDIILDKDADIQVLIEEKTLVDKNGNPLAVKIEVG